MAAGTWDRHSVGPQSRLILVVLVLEGLSRALPPW